MITTTILFAALSAISPAEAAANVPQLLGAKNPADIELQYNIDDVANAARQWDADQNLIERYRQHAKVAVTGKILTTRKAMDSHGPHHVVTLLVRERLRGKVPFIYEFRVDPPSADPAQPSPELISGYEVLVFVDKNGWLVDGQALYALEGGWAWRNRRAGTFLKPRVDRDWVTEMDPQAHYVALSMVDVRERIPQARRSRHN